MLMASTRSPHRLAGFYIPILWVYIAFHPETHLLTINGYPAKNRNQTVGFLFISFQEKENLAGLNQDDCLNYKKLSAKLGDFIQLKDSIRVANVNLDVLKNEYLRCIEKNKNMRRRLFIGNVY
jgi:hypothetical protein